VKTLIGDILPLAIVVTVSPINIVAAILLLFSKQPIANATSYLIGFILGVAAMLAGATALAGTIGLEPDSDRSRGASALLLALGAFLIVVAVRKFGHRPGPGDKSDGPKWMQGITDFGAGKGFVVGLSVGALNPKNIVVAVAAAVTIATTQPPVGQQVAVIATYVVVASLGVAAPIVAAVALGDRSESVLSVWKEWLDHNNGTVMAVIYLVFGVILLGKGISGI
jgi:threonine/homoserine/homoserine lactone efflux protein